MSNKELLPLETILDNLKRIANEVRTNPSFRQKMEKQLKHCGYNWFGGISKSDEEQLKEQVMKALAKAVNVAIQKRVDSHFIPVYDESEYELRSPLDLAKYLKKTETKSAPQWLVESIIQHQFDIRWNTLNGDPDDYTFYEFCDNENTTELLKYIPRQAHVKATLYKECKKINMSSLREITEKKENLCPTVYIRIAGGWKSWRADKDEFNDIDVKDINTDSWIDSSILKFITENADEQSQEVQRPKKSLKNPTLYWAVLDDSDFKPGEKLRLKEIGRTQVYVGKAKRGIQGRWTTGNNHCAKMKRCLDNVCAMTTYDPSELKGITLVDARLALAKVRGEKTALFVIKTFGDESDATDPLTEAEKWHLEGKRVDNEHNNIIQFNDESEWKPKDMRYGMNSC